MAKVVTFGEIMLRLADDKCFVRNDEKRPLLCV